MLNRSCKQVLRIALLVALVAPTSIFAQEQGAAPAPAVTIVKATMKALSDSATFSGRIEATHKVDILARVDGFIDSIGFSDGAKVKADDVLIKVEPEAYEAAITQIEGQIKSAEAKKTLADIELNRQQILLSKGDVAEKVVQEAEAQQGQIDGEIQQLQGSLQVAKLNLSYTEIKAPFDGRVGLTDLATGAYIGPNSGVLFTLSSVDPINVTFPVTEAELIDFRDHRSAEAGKPPLQLNLTLANGDVYKDLGTVDVVDTQVQTGTDTVLVRGVFPNSEGHLLDGQLVQVAVSAPSDEKSLVVPVQALQRDQKGYFVLTVGDDGKVAKTAISLDHISGADAVLSGGLSEGDPVITEGAQKVRVGMIVDAKEPQVPQPTPTPAKDTATEPTE
jgi:membrane fusion protein, multidrug efflux system